MAKYYRVKFGFGKDDFYSISEEELPKALKAQINGGVVVFEEGSLAGNNIMAIKPDYNRLLGLNREYEMVSEDYREIPRSKQQEYMDLLSNSTDMLEGGNKMLHE